MVKLKSLPIAHRKIRKDLKQDSKYFAEFIKETILKTEFRISQNTFVDRIARSNLIKWYGEFKCDQRSQPIKDLEPILYITKKLKQKLKYKVANMASSQETLLTFLQD